MPASADTLTSTLGRWLPSPFLKGSLAFHAAAATAVAVEPGLWPLALGGLAADHLIISASGIVPRGDLLGPNLSRLPAGGPPRIALTVDDGPDPEVTPPLLDALDREGIRATFFCIGVRVAAEPKLAREILRRGHALENHSLSHPYTFSFLGPRAMAAEVDGGQRVIEDVLGHRPRFFRAPAGLRNPFLEPILRSRGLSLASWTRRGFDTVAGDAALIERRLLRGLAARDILLLHDGRAARTRAGVPVALEVLPALARAARAAGLGWVTLPAGCAP
ncbi:MAG: polysaccharide deacetylase family protein [Proteobacteria bacterium]|nr:polysaccharide deacetylase family protein [Pseudomonadota bacterium]